MNLFELFNSTQGEGSWAGQYTTFVRFSACNLWCSWCDEPGAIAIKRPASEAITAEVLLELILSQHTKHICFTGGEPLIQDTGDLCFLMKSLKAEKKILSVETNGTKLVPPLAEYLDMWTISPKLSSAENVTPVTQLLNNVKAISLIAKGDIQLKFVIGSLQDVFDLKQYISAFSETILFYVQSMWIEQGDIFEPKYTVADLQRMFREADIDFANIDLRFGVQLHKFFNVK